MTDPLGRRALLRLAGAGVLGAAAAKALEHVGPAAVNAQDALTVNSVRRGKQYPALPALCGRGSRV
jgi:hypothetical protein